MKFKTAPTGGSKIQFGTIPERYRPYAQLQYPGRAIGGSMDVNTQCIFTFKPTGEAEIKPIAPTTTSTYYSINVVYLAADINAAE